MSTYKQRRRVRIAQEWALLAALVWLVIAGILSPAHAQTSFNRYGPVAGLQKSTGLTPYNTAATSADVISLWSGTCDVSHFLAGNGTCAVAPVGANPTGSVGLTGTNGSAATFLRSDGAPPLNQGIAPTWTGNHTFSPTSGASAAETINNPTATAVSIQRNAFTNGFSVDLFCADNAGPQCTYVGTQGVTKFLSAASPGDYTIRADAGNVNFSLGGSAALDYQFAQGGMNIGAPTGGLKGAGTLNATGLYVNGSAVLNAGTAVTVAQGGTGLTSLTAHGVLLGEGTSAVSPLVMGADTVLRGTSSADPVATSVPNCGSSTTALNYSTSTHTFGCQTLSSGGTPGGSSTQFQYNNSGAFGGTTGLTWDNTNITQTIASAATNFNPYIICANGQSSGNKCFGIRFGSGGDLQIANASDAGVVGTQAIDIGKSGTAITSVSLGNATDNPAINVNGTPYPKRISFGSFNATAGGCSINVAQQNNNFSSCTRNGVGSYSPNYTTAYASQPICIANLGNPTAGFASSNGSSTTQAIVMTSNTSFTLADVGSFYVMCVGF